MTAPHAGARHEAPFRPGGGRPQCGHGRGPGCGRDPDDRDFNFVDPWGNHVEIVAYADVQFANTEAVLRSMGLVLEKSAAARNELRQKGIDPDGQDG